MKCALKLIFLKCIFEFMINTSPPASNSVYGREKLFWYDKINFSNHVCHCGSVDKESLARADKQGSTSGDAVFCFLYRFFFPVWSLFLKLFFLLAIFSKKVFVLYEAYFFPFKLEAFIFLMIVKSLLYGYWLSFMSFRAYRNVMNR